MDRCWAYTVAYQEEAIIGYWARHYASFCERVTVFVDEDTDDGTAALAGREGALVREYPSGGRCDDLAFVAFAQEHYPEARGHADWVVWVDADEFLYHPRIGERLDEMRRAAITYPRVVGYTMLAAAPPAGSGQIYQLPGFRKGLPAAEYGKPCVFDPALGVAWTPGKHSATVTGAAITGPDDDRLALLHYRYLGEAWMVARNARNYARLDDAAKGRAHGKEAYPDYEGVYSPAWYAEQMANAVEVIGG